MNLWRKIQSRTYVFLALMVLFGSVGNILLSKGMKEVGEVNQWSASVLTAAFSKILTSSWIWLGISAQLLFLVSFLLVLAWADYSFVFPASAIGYPVVTILGHLILGETVSSVRWAGVAMTCLGVALVGRTRSNTRERK